MTKDTGFNESASAGESSKPQPGPDEMFCTQCGNVIKKQAEICPECGVRQKNQQQDTQQPVQQQAQQQQGGNGLSERRQYELEKMASKDKTTVAVVGFLLSPVGYWMVGKKGLAIVNLLTLNFFFLGPIIVPIHCWSMISNAEEELRRGGVGGY